ncbi:MAG: hypothetical protein JWN04_447 [Myxococcaceae bacterium]|nr:hypothetical protein [Myxococcaceae bacterium]
MRRRLPLLGVSRGGIASPLLSASRNSSRPRVQLARASIGIADTGSGLVAAEFAVALAAAFSSTGRRVTIVLLGFEGVPALPRGLAGRLVGLTVPLACHAVDQHAPAPPCEVSSTTDVLHLWVGLPAVVAFAPALAVLLGADRPLTSWPALLRAQRAHVQLELSQDRPGLACALASSLNDHGFLPRR